MSSVELLSWAYAAVGALVWASWLLGIHSNSIYHKAGSDLYTGNIIFIGILMGALLSCVWPITIMYGVYNLAFDGPKR